MFQGYERHYRTTFPKILLLLSVLCAFPAALFSQLGGTINGETVVGGPFVARSYEHFSGGHFLSHGSRVLVAATSNGLYSVGYNNISSDFSVAWTPPPPRTIKEIGRKSVKTGNATDFTWNYYLLIMLDDGEVYIYDYATKKAVLYGQIGQGFSESFVEVQGDAVYALSSSHLYVTRDSGSTWQVDSAGLNNNHVWDFAIDSSQTVFIATGGGLYRQHPDSNVSHKVTSLTQLLLTMNVFVDRANRIIAGGASGLAISTNGGSTWAEDTVGIGTQYVRLMGDDGDTSLYVVTSSSAIGDHIYRSDKGTGTWQPADGNLGTFFGGNKVLINSISGDSTLLYVGTEFGAFQSTDHGSTWSDMNTGIKAENIHSLVKTPSGKIFVSTSLGIYSRDPGSNAWVKSYPQNGYFGDLELFSDNSGNVYAHYPNSSTSSTGMIAKTTDGGTTWNADTAGLYAVDGNEFYVDETGGEHYGNTLYGSSWYSRLWTKPSGGAWTIDTVGLPVLNYSFIKTIASDHNGSIYISGYFGGNKAMRRPIAGGTWTIDTAGVGGLNYFDRISAGASGDIIAQSGGTIMRHTGSVWTTVVLPTSLLFPSVTAVSEDTTGAVLQRSVISPAPATACTLLRTTG